MVCYAMLFLTRYTIESDPSNWNKNQIKALVSKHWEPQNHTTTTSKKRPMAGIKTLVGLAFAAATGLMFLFLGCALPGYEKWWPLFILFFYVLSPVPYVMSRRYADSYNIDSSRYKDPRNFHLGSGSFFKFLISK